MRFLVFWRPPARSRGIVEIVSGSTIEFELKFRSVWHGSEALVSMGSRRVEGMGVEGKKDGAGFLFSSRLLIPASPSLSIAFGK